ncbi:lysozyme family protein [Peribacillus sp. NPDC097264]|uniref:lysozyme family protein n=1 Tax=Peribacillus sp. NPDC097264 TaxID=3390616 RepID=UPI003D04E214
MRRLRKKSKVILILSMMLFLFLFIKQVLQTPFSVKLSTPLNKMNSFAIVEKYSTQIHSELKKYGLEDQTLTLIAVMQQESRGKGGDPMQASESAGLAPNTITDPNESIEYGVKHFQRIMKYGNEKAVDFSTIIQSYNMGIGYIDYVANSGGKHTEELAKQFSALQVEKNPELYDCGGNEENFRYPYCYGDFSYSDKVEKILDTLTKSTPAIAIEEKPDEAL